MTAVLPERVAAPTTIVQAPAQGGSLAIRPDQTLWSAEQSAVLRQSGIGDDVTAAELAGFLHLCQRTGLDPFSRQIYLIGRKDRKAGRVVFTPQTGIDGYRVIAQRVTGQTGGTYGYEDTLWCDAAGRWRDVWLDDAPPAAAKVTVIRNGARFSAVARFSEYAQTFPDGNLIGLWAKMPAGQIAKCCEALALRKAFPHDLAGVYTAEEMAQADNPEAAPARVQAPAQDQWQQPAPAPFDAAAEGDIGGGRDWINEATEATTVDAVREIYRAAAADGFGPGTATMQAIAERGKQLAAAELDAGADPATGDGNEHPPYTGPADGTPETLPGAPDDRRSIGLALSDMLTAGADVDVNATEVRRMFVDRYGHGAQDGTVAELRNIEADLKAVVR